MEESNDRVWNQKHKEQIKGERFKSKSERPQDGFSCPAARFFIPCNKTVSNYAQSYIQATH